MKNEVLIPNQINFCLSDQNSHFYSFQKCVHQHDNPFVSFRVSILDKKHLYLTLIQGAKRKIKFELELHTLVYRELNFGEPSITFACMSSGFS